MILANVAVLLIRVESAKTLLAGDTLKFRLILAVGINTV
jgi:hypothetical protein